jgi:hypothetical protein
MRAYLLLPVLLATAVLVPLTAPSKANAAVEVGIAENNPALFQDPLFTSLGVKYTRIVLPWDVVQASARGDNLLTFFDAYNAGAQAAGTDTLVTFEHTRGAPIDCRVRRNRRKVQCKLPSRRAYESAVRSFLQRYPNVKTIAPFNEVNHFTQPTVNNPRAAAGFSNSMRKICDELNRDCDIVVADMLDQANDPSARRPVYTETASYIRQFRRALRGSRSICGIHNYSDVNRFRSTGTKALIKALGCREYWLTETGGLYKFGRSFPASERRQARATRYMFRLAQSNRRIKRVYNYSWFGDQPGRFDSGIVSQGQPRRAYEELKKRL